MIEKLLAVQHFQEKHTSENISVVLRELLEQFKVSKHKFFTTDRAANIKCALRLGGFEGICCVCHILNNILENAHDITEGFDEFISLCRKLVSFFKARYNIEDNLKTSLKLSCSTRWSSTFNMLQSIDDNWDEIIVELTKANQMNKISGINRNLLQECAKYLKHFQITCEELQSNSSATLHLCFPYFVKLHQISLSDENEVPILTRFKKNVITLLDDKWKPNITILHKVAMFLYPPIRHLRLPNEYITQADKDDIYEKLIELMQEDVPIDLNTAPTSQIASTSNSVFSIFMPDDRTDELLTSRDIIMKEIEKYKNYELDISSMEINVLEFWNKHKILFPILEKAARKIFCIQASSASSERSFSGAGNLVDDKRSNLNPNIVNDILVIKSNFDVDKIIDV